VKTYKWRVETYVHLHNQTEDGYVVRFVHYYGKRKMYDQSKYFSRSKHDDSLPKALRKAREWKDRHLNNHLRNIRDGRRFR
jgi:hypothetical protein